MSTENWPRSTGDIFRMPAVFGPTPGPRQAPNGVEFDLARTPTRVAHIARFLTDKSQLLALMPPGMRIDAEPVVTVDVSYISNIEWLAGRGYNIITVTWPATYTAKSGAETTGQFMPVLWENLTDPILTGREDLGYSKLYAEIEPVRSFRGSAHCTGAWLGQRFFEMDLTGVEEIEGEHPPVKGANTLVYKYVPRTGEWGKADAAYVTATPPSSKGSVTRRFSAEGQCRFLPATWEQLPTLHHIVNPLAELKQLEWRGGAIIHTRGGTDLKGQVILE